MRLRFQASNNVAEYEAPAHGRFGAQANSLTDSARQTDNGQKRQRPHKAKNGMQGQSTYEEHGRLVKLGHTFHQSLLKYAKKKVVLRDRPTKKTRSPAKIKRPNKTTRKAVQQASPIHPSPVMPGYFPLAYSSSIWYDNESMECT